LERDTKNRIYFIKDGSSKSKIIIQIQNKENIMSTKKEINKEPEGKVAKNKKSQGFSDFEKDAMKERARELKAAANKADGENALLEKIAEMSEPDRSMAERIHAIIITSAPGLSPKTWYGMPAYAKNDKVVCFFQSGEKYKTRYSTLGFSDEANLDEGNMWPASFALKELTPIEEARIVALVKKAIS
jgi:uncharacterized protein YdhG (YjbR/CyaY superfamily)